MLCEGNPLLFYTPCGPVTPMGMYRGARRLGQRTGDRTGEQTGEARETKIYSSCPRLSRPGRDLGQAEIQAGQRSRPGGDPGQAEIQAWAEIDYYYYCIYYSRMLCEGSPLLFYTPWGPVTPMGMYRGARRLPQQTGEPRGEGHL